MRPRLRLVSATLAALLGAGALLPAPAAAQFPRYSFRKTHASAEWDQSRAVAGLAIGWPASFPSGWSTGFGWSLGYLDPIAEYCDLALDFEVFTHHFHFADSDLSARGATLDHPVSQASFGDAAVGFHFHAATTGWRPYALAQLALPDVSRPAVFYSDSTGHRLQEGSEIFGIDPGYVFGAGIEHAEPRHFGALVEARFVIAPGSTRSTEYLLSLRAALTVPLPRR